MAGNEREPRRRSMPGPGRVLLAAVAALVAAWLGARAWFDVRLPVQPPALVAFPDPMDRDLGLREAFEALPVRGADATLRLLEGNVHAWAERWRLLAGARERLDICYFILDKDVFGAAFLGHLLHKARDGVRIRVLLDALGTKMSRDLEGYDYLDALVNTEVIEVHMYRPVRFRILDAVFTLNPAAYMVSEHDKILVADGRRALTGGRNIAAPYFAPPGDDPKAFRDMDVLLEGAEVSAELEKAFEAQYRSPQTHAIAREAVNLKRSSEDLLLAYDAMDAWLAGRPVDPATERAIEERDLPWLRQLRDYPGLRGVLQQARPGTISAPVRILDSHSRFVEIDDPVTRSLIRLLRSAREEVVIHTPYVILLDDVVEVLAETAERGVAVTIVTNSPASTDNPPSGAIFAEQWPDLLARIPSLRLLVADDERNRHTKVAVLDRTLVLVGTYNLDPLSMTLNSEVLAAIWSPEAAARMRAGVDSPGDPARAPLVRYRLASAEDMDAGRESAGEQRVVAGVDAHLPDEAWTLARRLRPVVRAFRAFREHSVMF